MRGTCGFYNVTRRLLQERLTAFKSDAPIQFTDLRHFFYECRNKFLRENTSLSEVDSGSKNESVYRDWEKTIKRWCMKHSKELGFTEDLWWRIREKLNIWAEGKAVCEGETEKFLIDRETRHKITKGCSFVLVCEKKTVSKELLENLQQLGYKVNLVAVGGNNPSDVQEGIIRIAEEIMKQEDPNFYVLSLHDFDLSGVQMFFTLAKRYNQVIDCGVNPQFMEYLKSNVGFNARLVVEKVKNRCKHDHLRNLIAESEGYTLENFRSLQGKQVSEKEWVGNRIEIDAVHVEYGIQPFVNYIKHQIEVYCKCWDLTRIGVEEFELEEPPDYYKVAINDLETKAGRAYGQKLNELSKTLNMVLDIVKGTIVQPEEYSDLDKNHRGEEGTRWYLGIGTSGYHYTLKELKDPKLAELKEQFEDEISREWLEDFEEKLNFLNEKVHHYYGDVRTATDDLQKQAEALQEELNNNKEDDPDLDRFKEELELIDWGKDELEKIPTPDPKEEIQAVIDALEEKLQQL